MAHLVWSEEIQKRIRDGDWADQAVPTVTKIEEAVRSGRAEDAAQLVDYFMEEAKVCYAIYELWFERFLAWLASMGVEQEELDREVAQLRELLVLPDGTAFEERRMWSELGAEAGRLANEARGCTVDPEVACGRLDDLREDWRRLHDRFVDLLSGVLTLVADRFGEATVEDCYRFVLEPYIGERYMVYDLREHDYEDTLFRNVYTVFEAMRGHLCGPERLGDMDFEDHDDRYVFRFTPCGSGGRTVAGDHVEGTPPRPEAPYGFGVTKERYDWAWNEEGVCYYCAHCCFALERLPAERWGHPVRVVEPPLYQGEGEHVDRPMCQWTVYKRLDAIPARAYERIGMPVPDA